MTLGTRWWTLTHSKVWWRGCPPFPQRHCSDREISAYQICQLCPCVSQTHLQIHWNPGNSSGQWTVSKNDTCHFQVKAANTSGLQPSLSSPSTETSEMACPQWCPLRPGSPRDYTEQRPPSALTADIIGVRDKFYCPSHRDSRLFCYNG